MATTRVVGVPRAELPGEEKVGSADFSSCDWQVLAYLLCWNWTLKSGGKQREGMPKCVAGTPTSCLSSQPVPRSAAEEKFFPVGGAPDLNTVGASLLLCYSKANS